MKPAPFFEMDEDDASQLQRLGAALIIEWERLPNELRDTLVQSAADIGGIAEPMAQGDLVIIAVVEKYRRLLSVGGMSPNGH